MAKEVFARTKPHVNVGTIGHIDHGKTTTTAAIVARQAYKNKIEKFKSYKDIAKGGTERDDLLLARQVGVPRIVVYLNKVDTVDDPDLLDLVEMEVRDLLNRYEFPGDAIPVIRGSALPVMLSVGKDDASAK